MLRKEAFRPAEIVIAWTQESVRPSFLPSYDGYCLARLPANLLQSQRDFFGAHTYERTDQPRGKFYHLDWPKDPRPQYEM